MEISAKSVDTFVSKANLMHFDFRINRIADVDLKKPDIQV
jgi:hypothetical protein